MKKAIIITTCIALLLCIFCVVAAAEEEWSEANDQNVSNLSYIIKMLKDAGYTVNEETPFESTTGQITIGNGGIPANTTITTTMPITDFIKDFNANYYYAVYFEADDMEVTIGSTIFEGRYNGMWDGVEGVQFNSSNTVTITANDTITSINKFMVSEWTEYAPYITGELSTWIQSADYETGYLYPVSAEPETPDEPTVSGGSTATADDVKPLSLIPKQADLPKVWLLVRIALIGIAGTAVLVVLFKIFRPKMRLRRR